MDNRGEAEYHESGTQKENLRLDVTPVIEGAMAQTVGETGSLPNSERNAQKKASCDLAAGFMYSSSKGLCLFENVQLIEQDVLYVVQASKRDERKEVISRPPSIEANRDDEFEKFLASKRDPAPCPTTRKRSLSRNNSFESEVLCTNPKQNKKETTFDDHTVRLAMSLEEKKKEMRKLKKQIEKMKRSLEKQVDSD